jgi:hypothetical protein
MKEEVLKDMYRELHEFIDPFEGKEMVMFYLFKEILKYDSTYTGIGACSNCQLIRKLIR